jgi:hypothetical protein
MADKNIQMTQRNASNTGWDNLYPITKASNVQVTPISGLAGTDVQTVLQNLFQFANDGKTQIANAITAKGVSADPTETFASLAAKIGQISTGKKWASGSVTIQPYFSPDVIVSGLSFQPRIIIARRYGNYHVNGYDNQYRFFVDSSVYGGLYFSTLATTALLVGASGAPENASTLKSQPGFTVNANGFSVTIGTSYSEYTTIQWIAFE